MNLFLVNVFLFTLAMAIGCSKVSRPDAENSFESPTEDSDQTIFGTALKYMANEHFEAAIVELDKILKGDPNSEFGLVALFNKASALEGLGKCQEASVVYRQVVNLSGKKFPRIEAQSLFRLSYCFECLDQTVKQIASLKDALKRKKFLSSDVAEAELPARLAAAYAKNGDLKTAEKYFFLSQKGLKDVYRDGESPSNRKELLAKTLYFMGRMQPNLETLPQHANAYVGSLRYLQGYLLKSSEMGSREWSPRASKNLKEAYGAIWQALNRPPNFSHSKDEGEVENNIREWKTRLARGILENIQILKAMRFPDPAEAAEVQSIFSEIELQEKKVEIYLADLAVGNDLTPDAKRREGLRRQGRIKTSRSILEKTSNSQGPLPKKVGEK